MDRNRPRKRLRTRLQTATRTQKNNVVGSVVTNLFSQLSPQHARFLTWLCLKVKLKLTPTANANNQYVVPRHQSSLAGGMCNMLPLLSDISQAAGFYLGVSRALMKHIYGYHTSMNTENYLKLVKVVSFRLEYWKRNCTTPQMWNRVQKTRPDPSIVIARVLKHNIWLHAKLEQYKSRPFLKELKRSQISKLAHKWTGELYRNIQFVKHHNIKNDQEGSRETSKNLTQAREVEYALRRYMELFAPRAPVQPPIHAKPIQHLFRGICLDDISSFASDGSKMVSKKYLSFTTKRSVAGSFFCGKQDNSYADGSSIVMRLNVKDIPHWTPWIWFNSSAANTPRTTRRRSVPSTYDEGEVLLPPGTLTFSNITVVVEETGLVGDRVYPIVNYNNYMKSYPGLINGYKHFYIADAKYTPTRNWHPQKLHQRFVKRRRT